MEPLALKRAASVKFLLRKTQQLVLHSVGQKCQYMYKQMVLFHLFDSDCEQLSGDAHSICSQRIFKDMQANG